MSKQIETQPSSPINDYQVLLEPFLQTEVLTLLACFVFLIFFNLLMGTSRKGVIANARFGGRIEKFNALRTAQKQKEKKKVAQTALYLGEKPMDGWKPQVKTLLTGNCPCLPLPNLNQHLIALGSTGCGKTTTIVNRVLQAAIRDGHPLIIFDPKGELAKINAPYAKAYDYEDYYLAPGEDHTDRFNIVEWMRSSKDSVRAQQIAKTIQANTNAEGVGIEKTDGFFGSSGEILIRSVLMLTKQSNYPDLLMAKRILGLPDLCDRIQAAFKSGRLSSWIENSFQQFMSGKAADRTIAGIAATAGLVFDNFTQEEFFNAFIGKSTIPMDFTGQKILFVQPPIEHEEVVMPVLTTTVEILVEENMREEREEPLFLVLEEFPIGYWRKLKRWMTFRRSNGLAVILIAQLWAQVREKYREDGAKIILGNANTQIFFNSNDTETAKIVSERCGYKEVKVEQHSNSNGKSGHSHSTSEQTQKTALKPPEELTKVPEGEFTMFNVGFGSRGEAYVPIQMKYTIPQDVLDRDEKMKKEVWKEYIYPEIRKQAESWHLDEDQREAALLERKREAEKFLPDSEVVTASESPNNNYGIGASEEEEFAPVV